MGGGRRGGRQQNPLQNDDVWILKPLHDQPRPPLKHNIHSPSTSEDQTMEQTAQKSPKNRGNPKWVPRNRPARGTKPRFVKKSERISSKPELGSLSNKKNSLNDEVSALDIGGEVKKGEEDSEVKALSKNDAYDHGESKLSELSSSVEEPELKDEQLRINDRLQDDELLAMESIYGENIFILDRQRDLRSFQIHIHVEAPDELTITAELNSSNNLQSESEVLQILF